MREEYNVNGLLNDIPEQKIPAQQEMEALVQQLMIKLTGEIPKPICQNVVRREIPVVLSDGVKLSSVAYFPEGKGPWPVILHRFPYGPSEFPEHDLAAELFARQGFVYFTNRCRGTGLSEGYFNAFEQETMDGLEVLDFVSSRKWCDGNIGTYGASYMGHVQWSIAGTKNPALKTMYIQVYGGHPYETYYRNGMIRQDIWQSWITANGGDARNRPEEESNRMYREAFSIKPPENIGRIFFHDSLDWAEKIMTSPQETDDAWQKGFWKQFEDGAKNLSLPILLQCGWFDVFLQSQLDSWRALPEETRKKSLCLIGPWDHYGFANHVLPYPDNDRYGVMQIKTALQWFSHFLKGEALQLPLGGVEAYRIGDDQWEFYQDDLTSGDTVSLYLGRRTLTETIPEKGALSWVYNPKHPVKSLALGLNKGTLIGPEANTREDKGVYSFVSEPLETDVALTGKPKVELYVSSQAPATAVSVTFFDVRPEGDYLIFNDITDIRYEKDHFEKYIPGSVKKVVLESQDIAWTFKKGNRIRIDVTSSDFPWYNAHNNTTEIWGKAVESRITKNTVYFGADTPSKIVLPVDI